MTASTTARPDVELNPAEYTWVGYSDEGDASTGSLADGPLFAPEAPMGALGPARTEHTRIRRAANPSGRRNVIHPGGCDACGQTNLRYRHYFRHDPSGDVIVLGDQCVNKMDFASITDYQAAKRVKAQRERNEQEAAAAVWKAEHPEFAAALEANVEEHHILADMAAKLLHYGSLSEKQVAFAERLIAEVPERKAEQARREQEAAEAQPIPAELLAGRHQITGEIVYGDWRETEWGEAFKIVVRDDRGFKVWGTAPEALWEDGSLENGTRVTLSAAIVASDDDPAFGFYKRPTKAERVADGADEGELAAELAGEEARENSPGLLAELEDEEAAATVPLTQDEEA